MESQQNDIVREAGARPELVMNGPFVATFINCPASCGTEGPVTLLSITRDFLPYMPLWQQLAEFLDRFLRSAQLEQTGCPSCGRVDDEDGGTLVFSSRLLSALESLVQQAEMLQLNGHCFHTNLSNDNSLDRFGGSLGVEAEHIRQESSCDLRSVAWPSLRLWTFLLHHTLLPYTQALFYWLSSGDSAGCPPGIFICADIATVSGQGRRCNGWDMPSLFAWCAEKTVRAGLSVEAIAHIRQIAGEMDVKRHAVETEEKSQFASQIENGCQRDECLGGTFESEDDQGHLVAAESRFLSPCINWYEQVLEKDLDCFAASLGPADIFDSKDQKGNVDKCSSLMHRNDSLLGTLPLCSSWLGGFWEAHALLLTSGSSQCGGRTAKMTCDGKLNGKTMDSHGAKDRSVQDDDELMRSLAEQLHTGNLSAYCCGDGHIFLADQRNMQVRSAHSALLQQPSGGSDPMAHTTCGVPCEVEEGEHDSHDSVVRCKTETLGCVSRRLVTINMEQLFSRSVGGLHDSYRTMLIDLLLDQCCLLDYLAAIRSIAMLQAGDSLQEFLATLVTASKQASQSGSGSCNPVVFIDPQTANQLLRDSLGGVRKVPMREDTGRRQRATQGGALGTRRQPTEAADSLGNTSRCTVEPKQKVVLCSRKPKTTLPQGQSSATHRSTGARGDNAAARYVASLLFVDMTLVESTKMVAKKQLRSAKWAQTSPIEADSVASTTSSERPRNLLRPEKLTEGLKSFYLIAESNPLNTHTKLSFRNLQIRSKTTGPLTPILSEGIMTAYSAIFSYFLQIHLCYHHLTEVLHRMPPHCSTSGKKSSAAIDASLCCACRLLHHQLLHFLQTLCAHIADVLSTSWRTLVSSIVSLRRLFIDDRGSQVQVTGNVRCIEQLAGVHHIYVISILKQLMVPVDPVSQCVEQENNLAETPDHPRETFPVSSHPFSEDMCLVLTAADKLNYIVRTAADNPTLATVRCWALRQVKDLRNQVTSSIGHMLDELASVKESTCGLSLFTSYLQTPGSLAAYIDNNRHHEGGWHALDWNDFYANRMSEDAHHS
eukprot:GHVS01074449.1.p1 GENE.GHVS01074449.1~~GHVS01074449.1.p1  ORF type:complete len:1052 (+),score=82.34 GHVS01074449.1:490-3645(+)